ncbi:MAG: isoprenylcysteine carboxylmethyltransferase family protein [Chloroflexota bacterium]|nr:MAG: isoprenylcysteine carboxylmethyltransferase family protein [Chloroflexota bacterium]
MNDNIFRILILVLMVTAFSISIYFRHKAQRKGGDTIDRTQEGVLLMIVLRVTGLGVWLSVLAYIINPEWVAFAALPFPDWLRWFGFVLALLALPLIIWMFRSLGDNITDTVQTRTNAQLVARGPYKYIRHPLYSIGALFFIGLMLMAANALILIFGAVAFTMLMLRTPKEEEKLVQKFGDEYRDYMEHTARFIPGVI